MQNNTKQIPELIKEFYKSDKKEDISQGIALIEHLSPLLNNVNELTAYTYTKNIKFEIGEQEYIFQKLIDTDYYVEDENNFFVSLHIFDKNNGDVTEFKYKIDPKGEYSIKFDKINPDNHTIQTSRNPKELELYNKEIINELTKILKRMDKKLNNKIYQKKKSSIKNKFKK